MLLEFFNPFLNIILMKTIILKSKYFTIWRFFYRRVPPSSHSNILRYLTRRTTSMRREVRNPREPQMTPVTVFVCREARSPEHLFTFSSRILIIIKCDKCLPIETFNTTRRQQLLRFIQTSKNIMLQFENYW